MRFTLVGFAPLLTLALACSDDTSSTGTTTTDATASSTDPTTSGPTTEPTSMTNTTEDPSSSGTPVTESSGDTSADSSSTEAPCGALCGDGVICGAEECDCGGFPCTAENLGGLSCLDVEDRSIPGVLTGGTLGCNAASCRFDTSACTYCGDGEVNGNEECEDEDDINTSCEALGAGLAGPLTCDTSCKIDTSACTDCAFSVQFELDTCPDGFSAQSLNAGASASSWACGEPTVYGLGPGAAAPGTFGTNLSGPYNANEISALVSPTIDVSSCTDAGLVMSLRHWHNFEGGNANADGGIVQVSEDGVTWTTIAPTGGDLYDDSPITATYAPVNGVLGFTGSQDDNQWSLSEFDFSEFAGSNSLQVRFVFGSNGSVQQGGWYIDYMEILGSGK
jgi:hypothetical protein